MTKLLSTITYFQVVGPMSSYWQDKEKVRVKSLRKLIELLEYAKREYKDFKSPLGEYDVVDFLKHLEWGFALRYEDVSGELDVHWRTSYDYINAIMAIAKLLLEE